MQKIFILFTINKFGCIQRVMEKKIKNEMNATNLDDHVRNENQLMDGSCWINRKKSNNAEARADTQIGPEKDFKSERGNCLDHSIDCMMMKSIDFRLWYWFSLFWSVDCTYFQNRVHHFNNKAQFICPFPDDQNLKFRSMICCFLIVFLQSVRNIS